MVPAVRDAERLSAQELLARCGMMRAPAVREHKDCSVDYETGELRCNYQFRDAPGGDCRKVYCPHFGEMSLRRLGRLRAAIAHERKKAEGR